MYVLILTIALATLAHLASCCINVALLVAAVIIADELEEDTTISDAEDER